MSWDREEWVTTKEAEAILGYSDGSVIRLCQSGKIKTRRVPFGQERTRWLLRRKQVDALAEERRLKREKKAQGLKFCSGCGEWKKAGSGFWKGQSRCIPCTKEKNRKSGSYTFPWQIFGDSLPGDVKECVGIRKHAQPEDSLKYACMEVGFHHKGIPPGLTKRQAYCSWCSAPRCVHHPERTPETIRKLSDVPTRYPPHDVLLEMDDELVLSPAGMTAESGG